MTHLIESLGDLTRSSLTRFLKGLVLDPSWAEIEMRRSAGETLGWMEVKVRTLTPLLNLSHELNRQSASKNSSFLFLLSLPYLLSPTPTSN